MPQGSKGIWRLGESRKLMIDNLKPAKFKDYLTVSELSLFVKIDSTWIKRLERAGRIPKASRIQRGKLSIRLWSPEQANEIKRIIATHKVGRPPKER